MKVLEDVWKILVGRRRCERGGVVSCRVAYHGLLLCDDPVFDEGGDQVERGGRAARSAGFLRGDKGGGAIGGWRERVCGVERMCGVEREGVWTEGVWW